MTTNTVTAYQHKCSICRDDFIYQWFYHDSKKKTKTSKDEKICIECERKPIMQRVYDDIKKQV